MLASIDSLRMRAAVDGHPEPIAAGADHPVDDRFQVGDSVFRLLGPVGG